MTRSRTDLLGRGAGRGRQVVLGSLLLEVHGAGELNGSFYLHTNTGTGLSIPLMGSGNHKPTRCTLHLSLPPQ